MTQFPQWPIALANLGKVVFASAEEQKLPPFTIALCLPRVDFAAVFIGVGIISKHLSVAELLSDEQRIKGLIGQNVFFETRNGRKIVGRLEYCEISYDYKVCEYSKTKKNSLKAGDSVSKKHVLNKKDWNTVQPTDCKFDLERGASRIQIDKSLTRMSNLDSLGPIFDIPRDSGIYEARCLFSAVGNKSRLYDELDQNLQEDAPSSLRGIVRPQSLPEYESSFRCRLESRDYQMQDGCGILIAESSRSLGDLLHGNRNKHRIVLLGRNTADYGECSNLVRDAYARRTNGMPNLTSDLPEALRSLAFYHS
jgi:hypothetical protein